MVNDPWELLRALVEVVPAVVTARAIRKCCLLVAAVCLVLAGVTWFLLPEAALDLAASGLTFYMFALVTQVFLSRTTMLVRWMSTRPEAQLLADAEQRAAVIDDVARGVAGTGRFAKAAVLALLAGLALALALKRMGIGWLGPLARLPYAALMIYLFPLVLPLFIVVAYPLLWRRRAQRVLRERLVALGVDVCLKCGYDLTGNVSGRCPECGEVVAK